MNRWVSDEESNTCTQCNDSFTLVRRKHHCRVCGKIFCSECSSNKLLIPRNRLNPGRFDDPNTPLRTCTHCARQLYHIQEDLRLVMSKANTETAIERHSKERQMNLPFAFSLQKEIKKATYTLLNFTSDNVLEGPDKIPRELLSGAKGIAFLTTAKVGFLFTGRIGTGLVISRLSDGTWSAPSAIMMTGVGWGFQIGGELTDVILVLTTSGAVEAFSSRTQVSIGTELAISLGPVGRSAGTDLHAGDAGASAAFSYAHSKGLFAGVSLEASVISSRPDVNRAFYGGDVKPSALLSGEFARPKGAEPLYRALAEVLTSVDDSSDFHSTNARAAMQIRTYEEMGKKWFQDTSSASSIIDYTRTGEEAFEGEAIDRWRRETEERKQHVVGVPETETTAHGRGRLGSLSKKAAPQAAEGGIEEEDNVPIDSSSNYEEIRF